LLRALREHLGVGFAMVRSERHWAVALGGHGTHYLEEMRVEGEDPLATFGPNAAANLRRTELLPRIARR
jgi:hypothetical protein